MTRRPRARRGVGLAAAVMLLLISGAASVGAQSSGLIWPSEPIVLTKSDAGLTATVPVVNPTGDSIAVTPGPLGTAANENPCTVSVTMGGTVPAHRATTVGLSVAPRDPGCQEPTDGKHVVVLLTSVERAVSDPDRVQLAIRKMEAPGEDPKPTGLSWPKESVFLRRHNQKLMGSLIVTNPTTSSITVTPPSFGEDCHQDVPSKAKPEVVKPRDIATLEITGPTDCTDLELKSIAATALAQSEDGTKSDAVGLTLQAEVDWGRFGRALVISLVLLPTLALAIAILVLPGHRIDAPLFIDSTAPASWLTSIGAIGPLLTAFVSTTGLGKGLFGSDSIPQTTLIAGASGVALVLVGLAGLISGFPTYRRIIEGKNQAVPAVAQFALAAGISASSAFIALWAVHEVLSRLDLIGATTLTVLSVIVILCIGAYMAWSVVFYVTHYSSLPAAEPKTKIASPELVAAITYALTPLYGSDGGPPSDSARRIWRNAAEAAATDAQSVAKGIADKEPAKDGGGGAARIGPELQIQRMSAARFTRSLI